MFCPGNPQRRCNTLVKMEGEKMKTYKEITPDKGWEMKVYARDNGAEYVLTSARMHDAYSEYLGRYDNIPTAAWYRRHAKFERV